MLGDVIGLVAILVLIVMVRRQQGRLSILERDLDRLRKIIQTSQPLPVGQLDQIAAASPAEDIDTPLSKDELAALAAATPAATTPTLLLEAAPDELAGVTPQSPQIEPIDVPPPADGTPAPTMEATLGSRWAVWVGGLALALGGVFLIRYTIEAGIFGPELRLLLAALLGLLLLAGGEIVRRAGFRRPIEGVAGAYIPGILTAAGAFVLFGTVYAAHGIYDFIGPTTTFALLGAIALATILASLVHGQALAGVGLVGSYATPMLVSSQAPNVWALFVFIAIVLVAAAAIARFRDWRLLMGAAFAGAGLWTFFYVVLADGVDFAALTLMIVATLAALALIWLAGRFRERADGPSLMSGAFVGLTALMCLVGLEVEPSRAMLFGTFYVAAMLGVALWRPQAIALLHGAGIVAVISFARHAFTGTFTFDLLGEDVVVSGFEPSFAGRFDLLRAAVAMGLLFSAAGLWNARQVLTRGSGRSGQWTAWAVAVPLAALLSDWIAFGNPNQDGPHAVTALVMTGLMAVAGELLARAEHPARTGGAAVSIALAGSGIAFVLALQMGLTPGWTTLLIGASACLPALATRVRSYDVLGWLSAGASLCVLARLALDPTVVGQQNLSTTPFLNWLLPAYAAAALGAGFSAWLLARTTGGRPVLVQQALAAFFALIGAAMLVRHAMHGGVINDAPVSLSEQSVYTLIALAGSGVLISLGRRAPGPVFTIGSMAIGVLSAAMIVLSHLLFLNPLLTDESTGGSPVLNLLFIGYLLPALAAGGLASFATGLRPRWYIAMLAMLSALLIFAYASLQLRRLFHGEFIAEWRGFTQVETYSYSALWLALGVLLLVLGLLMRSQALRLGSGALIVLAVAKVFLFDMSELEGVLRALSFIGLGVVLIGIGLLYQRMLRPGMGQAHHKSRSA